MAMGMQWTDISPMAIGTQFIGSDLRTGIAHAYQQSSTWTQWIDANLRVAGAQWIDISLRVETIYPYLQDPRETWRTGDGLRAINTQQTGVHPRVVDK